MAYCEAFSVIADYCLAQGWAPVGVRDFSVGAWDIRINGTPERRWGTAPFSANVVHRDVVAIMVLSPGGGTIGGWPGGEDQFIADMREAIRALPIQAPADETACKG
jgi:hypothetical protein